MTQFTKNVFISVAKYEVRSSQNSMGVQEHTFTQLTNRLCSKISCVWVCMCTYNATIVTQQRYKQCDIPALFVNLPRTRVKHTADRIMSGEHPQCIWCGEKGQGSDYTSIGVTVWCQNVSITCSETGASSIHKKQRCVCTTEQGVWTWQVGSLLFSVVIITIINILERKKLTRPRKTQHQRK